ncbi:hypothetical protein EG850_11175 [Gulosibacter macacae]|uniref:Helix-turn-helix domain-containing protein n=1 Tax=Gulosibacter macacae TaxID=2488791 RepID=A0A3P3VTF9_9MICO|nr:hypothetical protein [Gulosibacter macacae]RRJ85940.1 hypothetical protein EG850_11175 [Gulosibacter macacae]
MSIAPVTPIGSLEISADDPELDDIRLMRASEFAALAGVAQSTLHRWDADGVGPVRLRLAGSTIRYREADVRAFIEESAKDAVAAREARAELRAVTS